MQTLHLVICKTPMWCDWSQFHFGGTNILFTHYTKISDAMDYIVIAIANRLLSFATHFFWKEPMRYTIIAIANRRRSYYVIYCPFENPQCNQYLVFCLFLHYAYTIYSSQSQEYKGKFYILISKTSISDCTFTINRK